MFNIGWSEMLVIAIVLIVVVGPKDLPKMLRTFGRTTSGLRRMAGDFRKQFDDALREAELDDLKSLADDARKLNPASQIKKALNPMEKAARDVRAGFDEAFNPKPAAKPDSGAVPASTEARPAAPLKTGSGSAPAAAAASASRTLEKRAEAAEAAATPQAKPAAAPKRTTRAAAATSSAKAPAASPAKPPAARKAAAAKPAKASTSRRSTATGTTRAKSVKTS